ncbi:MAG: carbon monoxide dehydrogenase [Firmicutes bacterium ML8_F2]|nr:MAG: carbon monoxide dehydrogenase [Firmicutes bacterium ML8_F2]
MSDEKKKIDNRRTADLAALSVIDDNSSNGQIETSYERFVKMQPQCNFGEQGICCRICLQGPCRITKKASKGICGAHDYTIVARNLIRMMCGGCAAHADHARHMTHVGEMMIQGKAEDYTIMDKDKLYAVADRVGVEREGKNDEEVFEDLVKLAKEDLTRFEGAHEKPFTWLSKSIIEERVNKLEACNIMPRGVFGTIGENIAQTHVGMDADPVNLVFQGLKTSVADFGSEHIATDFSDIIFGTPKPVVSEANLGVLDKDYVNLAVHGHNPILSEMIVRAAREMRADAEKVGAKGIKVSGICCTGNEVLMRQGVPVLTNFTSQELPIMTGALDAMVVDIQCIMPGIRAVAECFHTKIITTSVNVKIPGAYHVDFVEDRADEKAREVINLAISAYKERNPDRINIPQIKHKVVAGFSTEAILNIFSAVNPDTPIKVLTDAIESGELRGVVLLCGCNNLKRIHDNNHLEMAKDLARNNVFMVATGCAAGAYAKAGMMTWEAVEEYAGDGLKAFLGRLNEANKLKEKLPLVFHMGSCVDNSRAYDLMTAMARQWGVDTPKVPYAASAPEAMSEKAVAIGSWCVTLGMPTHVGVYPYITGSDLVNGIALQIADDVYGGYFMWEEDPHKAVEKLLYALDDRTWKMKVHRQAMEKYETESISAGW